MVKYASGFASGNNAPEFEGALDPPSGIASHLGLVQLDTFERTAVRLPRARACCRRFR